MARARINPRLAKRNRAYTVEELARTLGVSRQTVRNWLGKGLKPIDSRRPTLVRGEDVQTFHAVRRQGRRVRCKAGEIYCVPCRAAKRPEGDRVECVTIRGKVGDLRGMCPDCGRPLHRRVSLPRLREVAGTLQVRVTLDPPHLGESTGPTVNCHFNQTGQEP